MRPKPVTKPSPAGRCSSMPKSVLRWRMNLSSSSKVFSSRRRWMRSRAVSLPALCSRSRRSAPPPASASSEIRRSSAMRSRCFSCGIRLGLVSANGASLDGGFLRRENAHGKVCGNPRGSEKQNDAKEHFRTHGKGALQGRLKRSHIFGCANENEHRPEGQRYDQQGGESGGKDHFHGR